MRGLVLWFSPFSQTLQPLGPFPLLPILGSQSSVGHCFSLQRKRSAFHFLHGSGLIGRDGR